MTQETPKNGLHTENYDSGQIQWERNYKNDKLDGKWTYWDANGQKWDEINYKDGKCISGDC